MTVGQVTIKAPRLITVPFYKLYPVGTRVKIVRPRKGHSDKLGMEGTISRGMILHPYMRNKDGT